MTAKLIIFTGVHPSPMEAVAAKFIQTGWQVKLLNPAAPKWHRHSLFVSIFGCFRLVSKIFAAGKQLRRFRPLAVVSFGGYSALPVCIAAKLLSLPLVIHEQTFSAGLTTRLTALLADQICLSWSSSRKHFPQAKTVLTGNPIRTSFLNLKPETDRQILFISGGHFGSQTINKTITPILPELCRRFKIYHQFGLKQSEGLWQKQRQICHPRYILRRWFNEAETARIMNRSSLVICRSGINTVVELAYLGKRAVLIPLLTAQKNEQLTNGRWLEALGFGFVLNQSELNPNTLLAAINQAVTVLPRPAQVQFNRSLAETAAEKIYQVVLNILK